MFNLRKIINWSREFGLFKISNAFLLFILISTASIPFSSEVGDVWWSSFIEHLLITPVLLSLYILSTSKVENSFTFYLKLSILIVSLLVVCNYVFTPEGGAPESVQLFEILEHE